MNVSGDAPSATPSRVISARPRVMSAARGAELVFLVAPSHVLRTVVRGAAPAIATLMTRELRAERDA